MQLNIVCYMMTIISLSLIAGTDEDKKFIKAFMNKEWATVNALAYAVDPNVIINKDSGDSALHCIGHLNETELQQVQPALEKLLSKGLKTTQKNKAGMTALCNSIWYFKNPHLVVPFILNLEEKSNQEESSINVTCGILDHPVAIVLHRYQAYLRGYGNIAKDLSRAEKLKSLFPLLLEHPQLQEIEFEGLARLAYLHYMNERIQQEISALEMKLYVHGNP